jgi:hypothetical protein
MHPPTEWRHTLTDADAEFARRLLRNVWREHGDAPRLDRWVLASVLTEVGKEVPA